MATAESVKAKLQGLIANANSKTGASDTTVTDAVNRLIGGYGTGSGGSGIIDVTELPTENITSDVIYRVTYGSDIFCLLDADTGRKNFFHNDLIGDIGAPINIEYIYVDAIPKDMKESKLTESGLVVFYIYALREEGVGYVNVNNDGVSVVITLGQLFETEDRGLSYDIENESVSGIYMYGNPVIERYVYFEGAWTKINPPEPDFWFKPNEDGESYSVSAHKELSYVECYIPEEHNDLPITNVGNFSEQDFPFIYLPDSITDIGDSAFLSCSKLSEIRAPNDVSKAGGRNVISIGDFAFQKCFSLNATAIPLNVQTIGRQAFYLCHELDGLPEWKNLTKIGDYAFGGCQRIMRTIIPDSINSWSSLDYIKIPSNVMEIGDYIFTGNLLIEQIRFAGKPMIISDHSFAGMYGLKDIYVPWSQGEVAGAPWGATNATIHYNYTE